MQEQKNGVSLPEYRVGDHVLLRLLEQGASPSSTTATNVTPTPKVGKKVFDKKASSLSQQDMNLLSANHRREATSRGNGSWLENITGIKGNTVHLSAGENRGLRQGMIVHLCDSSGNPLVQLQLTEVTRNESRGSVVEGDLAKLFIGQQVLLQGDMASAAQPEGAPPASSAAGEKELSTPLPDESRRNELQKTLPSYSVPRSDRSYALLGSLAAAGLIDGYPARIFYDDGLFHHRPSDDLILTRRQIAGLIAEVVDKFFASKARKPSTRDLVTLRLLVLMYQEELQDLGYVPQEILSAIQTRMQSRIDFGVSGWGRVARLQRTGSGASAEPEDVTDGDKQEPEGNRVDLQANLYAVLGEDYQFFSRVNARASSSEDESQLRTFTITKPLSHWLEVEAGRGDFWWGPGGFGTLLLSDSAGPYDYLKTKMRSGKWMYEGFATVLDESPLQRNLYAHRVEYYLSPRTRLGIAETMTVPGHDLDPVLVANALIPFLPFHTIDLIRDFPDDSDKLASIYGEAQVEDSLSIYAEFLIDDFVIKRHQDSPHRLGQLFGLSFSDPERPQRKNLRLEFARLDGGVYLPRRADNPYFENAWPIGYPTAIQDDRAGGFQSLRFDGNYMLSAKLSVGGGYEVADYGTDRDVLMRQHVLRLRAAYDLSPRSSLALRYFDTSTVNADFVEGTRSKDKSLYLEFLSAF